MRAARAGEVQTVTGPVAPGALGLTLMHEHILCDVTPPDLAAQGLPRVEVTLRNVHEIRYRWTRHYGNHILDDIEAMTDEVALFGAAGGGTVVELTTAGMKPDPAGLAEISRRSGVKVVAGTGFYVESFAASELDGRDEDALAAIMVAHVRDGFGGTGVRAGIIGEIGVSDPWSAAEQRALRAAVVAQRETGCAINVHPGRDPGSPLAIARFVRDAGGDVERLIISHMDRTLFRLEDVLPVVAEGCVVEWDFFGIESAYYPFAPIDMPNDATRLDLVRGLLDRGHGPQVAISQDICTMTRLARWGGHGYAHMIDAVVPMMRRKGFSESEIGLLLVETPRRLLALV